MKRSILIFAFCFYLLGLQAQFQWAKHEGLYAYDYGYGIVTDGSGNVYVSGKYEDTARFSGTTLPCAGNHDIFVTKYTSSGSLVWVRTGGGPHGDYSEAMSTDGSYLYVSGEIEGSNELITFPGSTITLMTKGDNDAFFAKYDLNGNLLWAKSEGYTASEKALAITNDASGNIYISGYYTDSTKFNGTIYRGPAGHNIFLAKYDGSGNFQWFKKIGSAGRDEGKFLKCDNSGNVYLCGMFSNNCDFGGQILTTQDNYMDSYIAKFAGNDGSLLWVKAGGAVLDDVAWSMTMDNSGSLYICGEFNSYITFGSTNGVPTTTATNIYVAKFDQSGNVGWISAGGGPLVDRARGIGTDGTNIFVTGQFGGTANFGASTVNAADSSDIFIAGLNNSGAFLWAISVGGNADAFEGLGYESGNAVTCVSGMVYVTGALLNNGVFGNTTLTSYGRTDMFLAQIATAEVGLVENHNTQYINIYPNPCNGNFYVDLGRLDAQQAHISIYNCLGQACYSGHVQSGSNVALQWTPDQTGIYTVEVRTDDQKLYRKKLIIRN